MVKSLKSYIEKQNRLTKQLEDANEQLKYRDQLKDDFINVAAHELRTPIQPILGLTEYLQFTKAGTNGNSSSNIPMTIRQEEVVLDIILRNSKRLMYKYQHESNIFRIKKGSNQ